MLYASSSFLNSAITSNDQSQTKEKNYRNNVDCWQLLFLLFHKCNCYICRLWKLEKSLDINNESNAKSRIFRIIMHTIINIVTIVSTITLICMKYINLIFFNFENCTLKHKISCFFLCTNQLFSWSINHWKFNLIPLW